MITSKLFEAYLACPTKCYRQSIGEMATQNDFGIWDEKRRESYRLDGVQRLIADPSREIDVNPSDPGHWKRASWDFAVAPIVRTKGIEATFHAVQRGSLERTGKSTSPFTPIRFVPENKLSRSDKQLAAFDALVLSRALGTKIGTAIIIHGDKRSAFTVKVNAMSHAIHKALGQIAALISAPVPPDLILNVHCSECGFQASCRKKAVEKDDLSLLAKLPDKERARLNRKGIFTVSQLSYTFRPRRRIKRLSAKPEKYHHSLKALAIRERKIHVVGNPQFHIEGTPIYFDVEGLPDRDFYYLIGVRVEGDQRVSQHSFWADTAADEEHIWRALLEVVSSVERPVLIHYGSFELTFLKKMCDRYGGAPEDSPAATAIASSVDVLSVIFAQVYFPAYSNGLKDIAKCLGFEWTVPSSSGLQSIV